jgi:hypothetical protein
MDCTTAPAGTAAATDDRPRTGEGCDDPGAPASIVLVAERLLRAADLNRDVGTVATADAGTALSGAPALAPAGAAEPSGVSATRPTRGIRVLLGAFCCLTALAVLSLVVGADRTAETFAWTIDPPVSAAFLGSGYAAGFVLSVLALRSGDWREVRVPYVTVLVFTWITAASTFYHLHRLHVVMPGTGPLAEPAAWLWIGVYVVVPVTMTVLLRRQPGGAVATVGGSPAVPLPHPLRVALIVQGLVLGAAGVALLVRCLSSHGMPGMPGMAGMPACRRTRPWRRARPPEGCGPGRSRPWRPARSPRGCSRSPSRSRCP